MHVLPGMLTLRLAAITIPLTLLAALTLGRDGRAEPAKSASAAAHAAAQASASRLRRADVERSLRRYLDERMSTHGADMGTLWRAVVLLDFETATAQAARLRATPRLARPSAESKGLGNDLLPPPFYDLQDALYDASVELERQARAKDAAGLAAALSKVTGTCVACHSIYLGLPAAP